MIKILGFFLFGALLVSAETRFLGPSSKNLQFDSLKVGVAYPFSDTLRFLDGADTLVAPYSGTFRLTAPADTVVMQETTFVVVSETASVADTALFPPPVEKRWVVGSDTLIQVRLDSCAYILFGRQITPKPGCR